MERRGNANASSTSVVMCMAGVQDGIVCERIPAREEATLHPGQHLPRSSTSHSLSRLNRRSDDTSRRSVTRYTAVVERSSVAAHGPSHWLSCSPMPRLGHKKSRLGCRQCKARHVKCDELKPCSNCARHGVPCSLVTWDPNTPQPSSLSASSASTTAPRRTNHSPSERHIAASSSSATPPSRLDAPSTQPTTLSEGSSPEADQYPFLSRFIHRTEVPQADLWLRDLELLHIWTTEAYDDLSHRNDIRRMWRIDAPKHAVTHPYLMHEMLAFAAFHMVNKTQNELRQEYYTFGVHHQDCAIRGLRRNISSITAHEAPSIIATSTLLTLSVFASTGFDAEWASPDSAPSAIDGLLNCFYLAQGMGNVLALAQAIIKDSFLGPMFSDPPEVTPSQPLLLELMLQTPSLTEYFRNRHDLPESERATYIATTACFDPCLSIALPPKVDNRELRFLMYWPLHINADFMGLVQQRRPGALVILMYYSTVLLAAEPGYWFMNNWGQRVLKECHKLIDQSWFPAIQWPLSFLNSNNTFDLFTHLVRRQDSAASAGGMLYPQLLAAEIPHRDTPPTQPASRAAPDRSSPPREFVLKLEDSGPVVQMANSAVPTPSTDSE